MSERTATFAPSVAGGYDFSPMRTVVDIGGGKGTLLAAILSVHAHLQGVLFELLNAARWPGCKRRSPPGPPRRQNSLVRDGANGTARCGHLSWDAAVRVPGVCGGAARPGTHRRGRARWCHHLSAGVRSTGGSGAPTDDPTGEHVGDERSGPGHGPARVGPVSGTSSGGNAPHPWPGPTAQRHRSNQSATATPGAPAGQRAGRERVQIVGTADPSLVEELGSPRRLRGALWMSCWGFLQ